MAVNLPIQNFFTRNVNPTPWVRPTDWPVITDAPNEVQFLFSDLDDASCTIRTQFSRTSGSQNIIIDWGDGTTDTVSTTTQVNTTHVYTPGTGTPCSRGYTTFKIRVYFTGGGTSILTATRILPILLVGNTSTIYTPCPVLEMYYGDNTQTSSMTYYYSGLNGLGTYNYLEYVKLPSIVTFTDMTGTFQEASSLSVVVMPTSAPNLTGIPSIFTNCYQLQSISIPSNAISISNCTAIFQNCYSLISITLPTSLNSCTTFQNTFQNCWSLKNVTLPSINSCKSFSSTFINCYSLEWVKFTSLPVFVSPTTVTFTNAFNSCSNLQNVYFPSTCSINAIYTFNGVFSNSPNLRTILFPINFNPTSLSSAFSTCTNLKRVTFQSAAALCTDMSSMFSNCINLTDVTLPPSVSPSGVNFATIFNGCRALESITIDSSYLFTNLSSTFNSCTGLKNINWNPGVQNSVTSMSSCFNNCLLLKTVTMPTSMNACTNLTQAFSFSSSIESITFPATMNSVTTMLNTFNLCSKLTSVTLPTSMTACTSFASTFVACRKLISVTLPATVSSAATNFSSTFQNCWSLQSVTFPTNQLSSVSTILGIFSSCSTLSTITNFDKIGSLTATPLVNALSNTLARLLSISFSCPLSGLVLSGNSTTKKADVQSVRLLNTSAGQWTGSSPQINVSYTNMSTANIVQLFNDMAAQGTVVSKTINITGATGASGLTPTDRLIVTSKGWTITG